MRSPVGLKLGWLFALALLLQVAVAWREVFGTPGQLLPWLVPGSYGLLLFAVVKNLHLWGFRLFLIGLFFNMMAMGLNDWRMPVTPEALVRAGYPTQADQPAGSSLNSLKSVLLPKQDTTLWLLTDIVVVPATKKIFSIGDFAMYISGALLLGELALRRKGPDLSPPSSVKLWRHGRGRSSNLAEGEVSN